jgi:hypothetical protein
MLRMFHPVRVPPDRERRLPGRQRDFDFAFGKSDTREHRLR